MILTFKVLAQGQSGINLANLEIYCSLVVDFDMYIYVMNHGAKCDLSLQGQGQRHFANAL